MASKAAAKAVTSASHVVSISQKQTLQSKGIWEGFRRLMAIDKNRSNGVPLNPYYRTPAPGQQDPLLVTDPVTVPAGDIAGNPYWKRDARRNYPRLSTVSQADAVALLTVGSAATPKTELIGEAGSKALVAATEAGKTEGLGAFLAKTPSTSSPVATDLFVDGLPPLPSGQSLNSGAWDVHKYELVSEQSYPEEGCGSRCTARQLDNHLLQHPCLGLCSLHTVIDVVDSLVCVGCRQCARLDQRIKGAQIFQETGVGSRPGRPGLTECQVGPHDRLALQPAGLDKLFKAVFKAERAALDFAGALAVGMALAEPIFVKVVL
ncbi:NADH-ubiquinone oxidoreductase 21.3 kDa subunit [Sporothrix brasiliensis 5110]|uniref:NADH-ubiquinone oxidoreductase 21.3 kDa subunit n=1 Tax=Sporothrix brasiliensis 5110 TaxID=1398154 RepID=A0A0C2FA05_9PEZI|nr:NADH-ubiquinone oxidoreductase 21.3 kDa subunit [Sporothrix brasiliensis 5110]KIH87938.1 NADH-ubiquinone oxidoreductase 21.3 kDa subunit [Sporothrix brasiliensis 5110]